MSLETAEWKIEMESRKFGPHVTVTRSGDINLDIGKDSPIGLHSWEFVGKFTREQAQAIGEATAAWLSALPRGHASHTSVMIAGFELLGEHRCEEKREHGDVLDAYQCLECLLIMCSTCAAGHFTTDHPEKKPQGGFAETKDQQR